VDYSALARAGTTLVFLMAVNTLPAITEALVRHGLAHDTPAATIADGTLAQQRVVHGTVATIADAVRDAGIAPPAITVIGALAGFDPAAAASSPRSVAQAVAAR
jgi:siroheme synthase